MPVEQSPPPVWEGPEAIGNSLDLIGVLTACIRRWRFIALVGFGGGVAALVISLCLTPKFVSKAVFLPPTQHISPTENPFSALLRTPSTAVYSGLLLSDTVVSDVVKNCGLEATFRAKDIQEASTGLRSITRISSDNSGFVTIEVTNKDPKLARDIASSF